MLYPQDLTVTNVHIITIHIIMFNTDMIYLDPAVNTLYIQHLLNNILYKEVGTSLLGKKLHTDLKNKFLY